MWSEGTWGIHSIRRACLQLNVSDGNIRRATEETDKGILRWTGIVSEEEGEKNGDEGEVERFKYWFEYSRRASRELYSETREK